jgi:hypothetical protein
MKKLKRVLLSALVTTLCLVGIIYIIAWRSPKYYECATPFSNRDSIIAFKDYGQVANHARPFIIQKSNLVLFGTSHTRDPKNKEIPMIEEKWQELKPTIALVEGRLGFLLPGLMNPVKTLGEGGKVKALAAKSGIPVYNWDLSKESLAASLLKRFTAEQIALAQILNPYFGHLRFGKPASPDNFIEEYIKRAAYVGLQDSIKTVTDIDRLWKKHFPYEKDWRDTSDEYALPGYLNEMMAASNDLRNQYLVTVVKELQAKGERVFVTCGSSHAVCVAPSFK